MTLLFANLPQLLRRAALVCPECPSADILIEHLIQIFKGSAFGLGDLEVDDEQGNDAQASENPSDLASQMRLIRVVQVRHHDIPDGRKEVVEGESNSHRLGTKTYGRDLSGYRHGWTDGGAIDPPG